MTRIVPLVADVTLGLFYVSGFTGAAIIIGGIWLIFKEKIYIDKETKHPIGFELPLLGKFKSNTPALALFFIGAFLIVYPIWKRPAPADLHLEGEIKNDTDYPFEVYAAVEAESVSNRRPFSIRVPELAGDRDEYKLLYLTRDNRFYEERVPVKNIKTREISLKTHEIPRNQVTLEQGKVSEKPPGF